MRNQVWCVRWFALAALFTVHSHAAPVEKNGPAPPAPVEPPQLTTQITTSHRHIFRHDLDDGGELSVFRTGLRIQFDVPIEQRARFSLNLSGEHSHYNFRGNTQIAPGSRDPFDDLFTLNISPMFSVQIDEFWSAFVGGRVSLAGEAESRVGESIFGGALGGVGFRISPDLTISTGLFVSSRLEDDPRVIPIAGIDWQATERLRIGAEGTSAVISYAVTEDLAATFRGGWESREFRLRRGAPISRGVVRDEQVLLGVGLTWRPSSAVTFGVEAGGVVYEKLEMLDRSGRRISRQTNDPALFAGVNLSFTF